MSKGTGTGLATGTIMGTMAGAETTTGRVPPWQPAKIKPVARIAGHFNRIREPLGHSKSRASGLDIWESLQQITKTLPVLVGSATDLATIDQWVHESRAKPGVFVWSTKGRCSPLVRMMTVIVLPVDPRSRTSQHQVGGVRS